jgi:hypothetical protein
MMPSGQTPKNEGTTPMFALNSRTILAVALLATVLAAPASASDGQLTTQQSAIGQNYAEAGPADTNGLIVQQSSQLETKAQVAEPNAPKAVAPQAQKPQARQKVTELRPSVAGMRQPSPAAGVHRSSPPLILGIGY